MENIMENENVISELFEIDLVDSNKEVKNYKAYLPSPFIAAALPLRDVKKNLFIRKYNNITLKLTGGEKVPFGKYGRLLLTTLTTRAVINKTSVPKGPVTIEYNSLNSLLKELQLPNSRCKEIKDQLTFFSNATFIFEEKQEKTVQGSLFNDLLDENYGAGETVKATKVSTGIIPFMDNIQYVDIENRKGDKQTAAISIVLSEKFVDFSRKHSVPINYTCYKNISSAIGKDIYAWLIYRNNGLKEPLFVSRDKFVEQFMPVEDTSRKDQIRTNWAYLKDMLINIKKNYYQELNIKFDEDNTGFTLYKSKAVIEDDDKRYILITSDL